MVCGGVVIRVGSGRATNGPAANPLVEYAPDEGTVSELPAGLYCSSSILIPTEVHAAVFTVTEPVAVKGDPLTVKSAFAVLLIGVFGGVADQVSPLRSNSRIASAVYANAFCCARTVRSKRRAGLAANLPEASPAARWIVRVGDGLIVKPSSTVQFFAYCRYALKKTVIASPGCRSPAVTRAPNGPGNVVGNNTL